jgi:hypothetical protein
MVINLLTVKIGVLELATFRIQSGRREHVVSGSVRMNPTQIPEAVFLIFHCVNNSTMDERGTGWPYLLPWHDCGDSFGKLLMCRQQLNPEIGNQSVHYRVFAILLIT